MPKQKHSYTAIYCFCGCGKVVEFCPEIPEEYSKSNEIISLFSVLRQKGYRIENKLGRDWIQSEYQNPCPNGHHYKESDHHV